MEVDFTLNCKKFIWIKSIEGSPSKQMMLVLLAYDCLDIMQRLRCVTMFTVHLFVTCAAQSINVDTE